MDHVKHIYTSFNGIFIDIDIYFCSKFELNLIEKNKHTFMPGVIEKVTSIFKLLKIQTYEFCN